MRTVTFYPYRFSSGKGTKGPNEVRGFIVVPDSLDVTIMGKTGIKKVKDSSEIAPRHALVYDYFDYTQNETRQNVILLEDSALENGNLADDFYKELWLRAKQLSNDLTDMFLLRQDNNTIYYFVNDFGKYGPYGKQLQQPDSYEQTLFGVRVLRCPYKYVAEEKSCAVDISMDAYVQKEEELAKVANFSFEGNAQLRKKNH